MLTVFGYMSACAIPAVILVAVGSASLRKVDVFDAFVGGAKTGIETTVRIIPPIIGLMAAIAAFRASGLMELAIAALKPAAALIGMPPEALPLAILRPISGNASLAAVSDIINKYGPDSPAALIACTIMGSTETTFYTIAVYFGAVGIKKIRYTLAAALVADAACILASVFICRLLYESTS
jgi:spore maturation protein B